MLTYLVKMVYYGKSPAMTYYEQTLPWAVSEIR